MATSPDLPSPIPPDQPEPDDPADLPVEPDDGLSPPAYASHLAARRIAALHLKLPVHRQFMRAANYRWAHTRTTAHFC